MQDNALEVKMFGTFTMEYQGQAITIEGHERTRTNQLLQRLICARNGIIREQLWRDLFGDENVLDPSNSMRALLHRLRKYLKAQGIPGQEHIYVYNRIYFFKPDCPIECDIHRFEDLMNEAKETTDDRKLKLLEEACMLYVGEFLPGLGTVEWAVILRVKYKRMYADCIRGMMEEYRKRKEYKKMYLVAGKVASIYPYDGWQNYQMEALIAMGSTKEAILFYEETEKLLIDELGVTVPQRMVDMMGELRKQVRNKEDSMREVLLQLNEEPEVRGPYECTYLSFRKHYHMISRMIERTGQNAWLILYTITDGKGYALNAGERAKELQEELCLSIRKTLRKGDMFTRYSNNQCLLLLMELKQDDCRKVVERIGSNLKNTSRKKYFTYNIAPVTGVRWADYVNTEYDKSRESIT